jgi:hypothetical protein
MERVLSNRDHYFTLFAWILIKKFLVSLHAQSISGKPKRRIWKKQKFFLLLRRSCPIYEKAIWATLAGTSRKASRKKAEKSAHSCQGMATSMNEETSFMK